MTESDDTRVRSGAPRGLVRGHPEVDPETDSVVDGLRAAIPEPDVKALSQVQLPKIMKAASDELSSHSRVQGPTGRPPSVITGLWHADKDVPPRRRVRATRIRVALVAAAMSAVAVAGTALGMMNPQVRSAVGTAAGWVGVRVPAAERAVGAAGSTPSTPAGSSARTPAAKSPKSRAATGTESIRPSGSIPGTAGSGKPNAGGTSGSATSSSASPQGAAASGRRSKGASPTAGTAARAKAKGRTTQSEATTETR